MAKGGISEHQRVHFNLAKDRKHGVEFEVPVDPELALAMRRGKEVSIHDIVHAEHIYTDAQKGELASEEDLKKAFGTDDPLEVAKALIKDGELQLTQEQREKMREEKHKKVINLIALHAVDPQSGRPHPPARIENALEQSKAKIDEFRSAEDQLEDVIKALRPIIPIKVEEKRLHISVQPAYTGKTYGVIQRFGTMEKERWHNDGTFSCEIVVPAGIVADIYERLNKTTESEVTIEEKE